MVMLMLIGAAGELVTLGAVIPFLTLLANPERVDDFPLLQNMVSHIGLDANELLFPMTVIFAAIAVTSASIRLLLTWAVNRYIYAVGNDLAVQIYKNTLQQPYAWHVSHNSSNVIASVGKASMVTNAYLRPFMDAIVSCVLCLVIIVALLIINPVVALIACFGFGAIYVTISILVNSRVKDNGEIISRGQRTVIQAIQEGLGSIRDVIIDGTHKVYAQRFSTQKYAVNLAQADNIFLSIAPRFLLEGLAVALIAIIAFYISSQPEGFSSALPVLGAIALGGQKLIPQLQLLYHGWARTRGNAAILNDVLSLVELTPVPSNPTNQLEFRNQIKLETVTFAYNEHSKPVLSNVDLVIQKGSRIGFIGETGSGKSTLLDLIMGLLEPTRGQILIDDIPLTDSNRSAWQKHIAHVPQSIFLSDTSILENIALGVDKQQIDERRVKEVAIQAQIDQVICNLPQGYDTQVGERGIRLSGGQKQRIGIARALYKKSDVLVLDEATSALDSETERSVVECIENLSRDLTVLVIAHRTSTLQNCDQIVKLRNGGILLDNNR